MFTEVMLDHAREVRDDFRRANAGVTRGDGRLRKLLDRTAGRAAR